MNIPISSQLEKLMNIQLESDFKTAIDRNSSIKRFPEGCIIIRQGNALDTLYYIKRGIVRGYYLDENGGETTKCFSAENGFAGSEGLLGSKNASFSVICLEDTSCIVMPYRIFTFSPNISRQFYEVLGKISKQRILDLERYQKELLTLDAEGRYRAFLQQYAAIAPRLKQAYIASYIGIQPSSLSRIKRNLNK